MMATLEHRVSFVLPGKIQPYTRIVRGQRRRKDAAGKRANAYHQAKERVAFVYASACAKAGVPKQLPRGTRFGVAVWRQPAGKRAKLPGAWPDNAGDWDNYHKLVPDALQPQHLRSDSGAWVRGPGPVQHQSIDGGQCDPGCYVVGEHGIIEPLVIVSIWTEVSP